MAMTKTGFITLACDGPECKNTATFMETKEGHEEEKLKSPWLDTFRFIQTVDGRPLGYCSDECEIRGVGTGAHNKQEAKRIITATQGDAALAAQAAARAAAATQAIKQGQEVTLKS